MWGRGQASTVGPTRFLRPFLDAEGPEGWAVGLTRRSGLRQPGSLRRAVSRSSLN